MKTEKTNTDPRIRLGPIALELLAPFMQNGEPVTKDTMEAALMLLNHKSELKDDDNKSIEKLTKQIETLTGQLEKRVSQEPSTHDDALDKEAIVQLSQLNKYHAENLKHQEYMLMGMSMLATEVRGLKRMIGIMATAGSSVEKEIYEATLKGIDRMNQGVESFREREGIVIPDIEKSTPDKVAHFENTSRGMNMEDEHEVEEKEHER